MVDVSGTVFRPKPSYGWAWLVALLLLVVVPMAPLLQPGAVTDEDVAGLWIAVAVTVPLVLFFLVALASLPAMRYELADDALVVSCGPLLRYRIPYTEITDVRRTDLTPSLWSSMRLPGLALWGVRYADVGNVHMCATRMAKGVLLISAGKRRYGITPADEVHFTGALSTRLRSASR
jgi:hypothetical protein